jgi:hypothetical protein
VTSQLQVPLIPQRTSTDSTLSADLSFALTTAPTNSTSPSTIDLEPHADVFDAKFSQELSKGRSQSEKSRSSILQEDSTCASAIYQVYWLVNIILYPVAFLPNNLTGAAPRVHSSLLQDDPALNRASFDHNNLPVGPYPDNSVCASYTRLSYWYLLIYPN